MEEVYDSKSSGQGPLAWLKCRPGAKVSGGGTSGLPAARHASRSDASYFCIKTFSGTDLTEDLRMVYVPTLILRGEDDQIVPMADSAILLSEVIKNSKLLVYKDGSLGICTNEEGPHQRKSPPLH
jgi:non-heme chloroperoxidase